MSNQDYEKLQSSLTSIASEFFRFQGVFEKAIRRLELDEQNKYLSQYAWFSKKVTKALESANLRIVNLAGQAYDPGMAVTPLNIDEFDENDNLYIQQVIEPIIMRDETIIKPGTVVLGRIDE